MRFGAEALQGHPGCSCRRTLCPCHRRLDDRPTALSELRGSPAANRPLLQPVLFVLGLVGTLMSFNVFDVIWLLTGGGPSSATTTLPVLIYDTAFTKYRLSQAAAISVIAGLLLLLFAAIFIRFMAPKQEEEA